MSNNEIGLMKKTKKELVEIILDKDDVESNLRKRLDECMQNYENLNRKHTGIVKDAEGMAKEIERLRKALNEANYDVEQHQSGIDEVTTQKTEVEAVANSLKKDIKKMKVLNWVLFICAIILAVCLIVII